MMEKNQNEVREKLKASLSNGSPSPTILVVEDDYEYLEKLKELLKDFAVQVQYCVTCKSALELMKTIKFDLIWLDMFFPRSLIGFEMMVNFERDSLPNPPTILVTEAKLDDKLIERANALGVVICNKPTDVKKLRELFDFIGMRHV